MKKFLQFVSATVVTMAVGFLPTVSAATSTCSITTTGPSSTNTCTVSGNNVVTVTCINGVTVSNLNAQTALSGPATVNNNTVSGTATSGDATNLNAAATQLAQNCAAAPAAAVTTPTNATPPATQTTTPSAGGQGAGAVQGAASTKVAALPNTGPNSLVTGIAVSAAAAGSLAVIAHVALGSYRRRAFKA